MGSIIMATKLVPNILGWNFRPAAMIQNTPSAIWTPRLVMCRRAANGLMPVSSATGPPMSAAPPEVRDAADGSPERDKYRGRPPGESALGASLPATHRNRLQPSLVSGVRAPRWKHARGSRTHTVCSGAVTRLRRNT
jgi:hypothetical protein